MGSHQVVIDVDKIRIELADLRDRAAELEGLLALAERYGHVEHPDQEDDAPEGRMPLAGMGTQDAVRWVLRTSGRPWRVDELTHEMQRLGWSIGSANPVAVVRTGVQRLKLSDPSIHRVRHGLYAYKEAVG